MNSWANEQFAMQNMMHPNMMQNMMPPGAMAPPLMQTLMVTSNLMPEINQMQIQPMVTHHVNPPQPTTQFIGPVIPENVSTQVETLPEIGQDQTQERVNEQDQVQQKQQSRDRNDRRDRERERERGGRRRSRSRNRDHNNKDRNNRGDRNRSGHRERKSKWDNQDKAMQQQEHMQRQHNMMQYANIMPNMQNSMVNQQIEMSNMQNTMMNQQMDMTKMPNMQHIMPGMNMMPNNMMINQQMQMPNQHMYFSNGVILPALPGTTTPQRRENPPGCRTIFVGGLPNGISEDNIIEIFQRFGAIDQVKIHKQGVCHVRYENQESVEQSFFVSGNRIKFHDQMECEATTLFVDYALNREDQNEFEKNKRKRSPTPPRIEQYSAATLVIVGEKIKSDNEFAEAAPTLAAWLERGECNKKNSNTFYALIQATNNQLRRLFNEKMQIDDEYQSLRTIIRDKFGHIIMQ